MNDIAKYSLELKNKDEDYTRYHIVGLQKAYYKYDWDKGKLEDFGGAAGLIRSEKYKGYCILCMTYHSHESNELPERILTVFPVTSYSFTFFKNNLLSFCRLLYNPFNFFPFA